MGLSASAGLIGAHERTAERAAYRNGYRTRTWDTRVGTIELAIPRVRPGTYFPSLLQPRCRAEHALLAVVQEAYVHGVSTRKVDELMRALGLESVSKSEVSRICSELATMVEAFRTRPLSGEHPYVWVDATYHKVRVEGYVTSHKLTHYQSGDGRGCRRHGRGRASGLGGGCRPLGGQGPRHSRPFQGQNLAQSSMRLRRFVH